MRLHNSITKKIPNHEEQQSNKYFTFLFWAKKIGNNSKYDAYTLLNKDKVF